MRGRDMFEGLGYKYKETPWRFEFVKDEENYFIFYRKKELITIGNYNITLDELEALDQQCRDMEWLDE